MTPAQVLQCRAEELENVMADIFYGPDNPQPLAGDKVVVDGGSDHIVYKVVKMAMPFKMPATKRRSDFMLLDRVLPADVQIQYPAVKLEGGGRVRIIGADRLTPFDGDIRKIVEGE